MPVFVSGAYLINQTTAALDALETIKIQAQATSGATCFVIPDSNSTKFYVAMKYW